MRREELKACRKSHDYSCVLVKNGEVYMASMEKGINPLYHLILKEGVSKDISFEMADKIVGRAVAFLARYLGVEYIYTEIISETALKVLEETTIVVEYEKKVPYIFNRNKDGQCPMEKALECIVNVEEAWEVIHRFKSQQREYKY